MFMKIVAMKYEMMKKSWAVNDEKSVAYDGRHHDAGELGLELRSLDEFVPDDGGAERDAHGPEQVEDLSETASDDGTGLADHAFLSVVDVSREEHPVGRAGRGAEALTRERDSDVRLLRQESEAAVEAVEEARAEAEEALEHAQEAFDDSSVLAVLFGLFLLGLGVLELGGEDADDEFEHPGGREDERAEREGAEMESENSLDGSPKKRRKD